jgi:hypothetical protein
MQRPTCSTIGQDHPVSLSVNGFKFSATRGDWTCTSVTLGGGDGIFTSLDQLDLIL